MYESEAINQRIPVFDASIDRMNRFVEEGNYEAFQTVFETLIQNAIELVHTYPDSQVAVKASARVFDSVISAIEKTGLDSGQKSEVLFVVANLQLNLLTDYLCHNASDRENASMLVGVIGAVIRMFIRYSATCDGDYVGNESVNDYFGYVVSMAATAIDNLKKVDPRNDSHSALFSLVAEIMTPDFDPEPILLDELGECAVGIQKFYSEFMG